MSRALPSRAMTEWLASTTHRRVLVARTCSVCRSFSSLRSRRAAEMP